MHSCKLTHCRQGEAAAGEVAATLIYSKLIPLIILHAPTNHSTMERINHTPLSPVSAKCALRVAVIKRLRRLH